MGDQNSRVPGRANAGRDQIDVGEIGEATNEPTGFEEVPIGELDGSDEAALEGEPPLADQSIGDELSIWELGEDEEEKPVGEEGEEVRRRRRRRRRLGLHLQSVERERELGLGSESHCVYSTALLDFFFFFFKDLGQSMARSAAATIH